MRNATPIRFYGTIAETMSCKINIPQPLSTGKCGHAVGDILPAFYRGQRAGRDRYRPRGQADCRAALRLSTKSSRPELPALFNIRIDLVKNSGCRRRRSESRLGLRQPTEAGKRNRAGLSTSSIFAPIALPIHTARFRNRALKRQTGGEKPAFAVPASIVQQHDDKLDFNSIQSNTATVSLADPVAFNEKDFAI